MTHVRGGIAVRIRDQQKKPGFGLPDQLFYDSLFASLVSFLYPVTGN